VLLTKSVALISVGISCQTAHQLRSHKALVSEIIGDAVQECATPFDWLLCPVSAAARMVSSGQFFPVDRQALDGNRRPYWPAMDVHFWHEHFEQWPDFITKATHVRDNWQRISNVERKVFILSNTQNNIAHSLTSPPPRSGRASYQPIECRLIWADVLQLATALRCAFGEIELHCVTHDAMATTAGITVHRLTRDESVWAGNDQAWHQLLLDILTNRPVLWPMRAHEHASQTTQR
jgi:hypothetical protein